MSDITTVISGMIEKVRRDVPKLIQNAPNLVSGLIGEKNVETDVNQKFYRIPLKTMPAGNFGKLSANFGTFGTGNSFALTHLICGYFYFGQSHLMNLETMETAKGPGSVVDAFSEMVADATDTMRRHLEITLHTSGDGVLTGESSAYSSALYTFAGASDFLGVNRLLEGMTVDVFDSTLTTDKGERRILRIDHSAKTVLLSSAPASSPAAGDRLVLRGMDVYGPATPTTFQSTYPTAGAAGVAGDSFIHGLDYYIDTTAANYLLGVQKSALPQLQPRHVAAGTAPLTYIHPIRLYNKMLRARGDSADGLIALVPLAQVEQLQQINMSLITNQLTGDRFGKIKNLAPDSPELGGEISFGGIPGKVDLRQNESKVQVIAPSEWGKVQPKAVDFYDVGGNYIHKTRNGDGAVTTGVEVFLYGACDYFCVDPGRQGVVDGLTVPTGSW